MKMGKTAAEVVAAAKKKQAEPVKVDASLAQFWRETVGLHNPKVYQPPQTPKLFGQLKSIQKAAGHDKVKAVLARVIEHWPSFVKATGFKGHPVPEIAFVLQNVAIACNFMQEDTTKSATKKAPATFTSKTPAPAPVHQPQPEPKATLDDILAPPPSPTPKAKGP